MYSDIQHCTSCINRLLHDGVPGYELIRNEMQSRDMAWPIYDSHVAMNYTMEWCPGSGVEYATLHLV